MANYFRDYCNQCRQLRQLHRHGTGWYCQRCLNLEGIDGHDYRETDDFIEYAATIEAIIHNLPDDEFGNPGEINLRALHQLLDYRARREWTQDALDSLRSVEPAGTLITRYRKVSGKTKPQYRQRWDGDSFKWIFAGKASQEREASFATSAR